MLSLIFLGRLSKFYPSVRVYDYNFRGEFSVSTFNLFFILGRKTTEVLWVKCPLLQVSEFYFPTLFLDGSFTLCLFSSSTLGVKSFLSEIWSLSFFPVSFRNVLPLPHLSCSFELIGFIYTWVVTLRFKSSFFKDPETLLNLLGVTIALWSCGVNVVICLVTPSLGCFYLNLIWELVNLDYL